VKNAKSVDSIPAKIFEIRGKKVMLDKDLAVLYGVKTKVLLQAVKRNITRFPADFMYQLTLQEVRILRSQFVTSNRGGRRYLPYVFTQEGVAMLSGVLNSHRAIRVNIAIMRAFVKLRQVLLWHREFEQQLKTLEDRIGIHDAEIKEIFTAIRSLISAPRKKEKRILGFGHK
jgi:hypothetical protein